MKRVYIAGNFSRNNKGKEANVIEVLTNMREGISTATYLLLKGFSVYCPWLDFQFGLIANLPKEIYQNNSMAWLEQSDVVLVISGGGLGGQVDREIERAEELNIPIYFYDTELLIREES